MNMKHACEPETFEVCVGGSRRESFSIRWERDRLLYARFGHDYTKEGEDVVLKPSPRTWEAFWHAVEEVGLWEWKSEYDKPEVGGVSWSVRIAHSGNHVNSVGGNTYPPDGDSPKPSAVFRKFCASVRKLIGGRPFYAE